MSTGTHKALSEEEDSSSSSSSYSSFSSSCSSSSPKSLSPRDYVPFFNVRQRRRPLSNISLTINPGHDNCPHETLRHDKVQRSTSRPIHWSSWFLAVALTIWLVAKGWESYIGYRDASLADGLLSLSHPRRIPSSKNFWMTDTFNNDIDANNNGSNFFYHPRRKKQDVEAIPDGCRLPYKWQRTSFPDCNRVHEIDLKQHLQLNYHSQHHHQHHQQQLHQQQLQSDSIMEYYIRSGLWRDVFSIRPDGNLSVVMKLMKVEHDVDERNLDRHRRDALTMERLTASPHVVDIYAFCGNTVVTEQAVMGLDERVKQGRMSIQQTIQWALEAARGVAALHSLDIIHADIQTQQFLLDTQGRVKINDFNRCRFLPRNNTSLEICPIGIPSAPGLWRAPEEYAGQLVVQAMDVYSLGNVIHELLVGHRPFLGLGASQVKRNIHFGVRPEIVTNGALSQKLVDFIYECLAHDVDKRIAADKLAQELEALVNRSKSDLQNEH